MPPCASLTSGFRIVIEPKCQAGPKEEIPISELFYKEIKLDVFRPGKHNWPASYKSDWAIAVGESE